MRIFPDQKRAAWSPPFGHEYVEDEGKGEYLHEVGEEELEDGPEDLLCHEDVDAHAGHAGQPVHELVAAAQQVRIID